MKKFFTLLLLSFLMTTIFSTPNQFKVVGYFVNWYDTKAYARSFDYSKVTHLNYAFVNVASVTGDLDQPGSDLDTLVARAHARNVKVLASLGGGSQTPNTTKWYNDLLLTDSLRKAFVHKFMLFLKKYNIDGWDIDLEGSLIKKGYYDAFIKTLSDSLRPEGKLLTAALGGSGSDNFNNETIQYFDWINIMSYDFTGSWTPNSPGQHASYEHALLGVTSWAARGAQKEQLIVGLPFYCHAFLNDISWDFKNYSDILTKYPYAYNQDTVGNIIYYNGIPTIKQKTCMAFEKAGGVMIWALQYDVNGNKSLLKAIDDAVKTYDYMNTGPLVSIESPKADTSIADSHIEIAVNSCDTDGVFLKNTCYINGIKIAELNNGKDTFKLQNLSAGNYKIIIEATDAQYKSNYDTINITVANSISRTVYNGISHVAPGKIEAEKYDVGGNNFTFKDNSSVNSGSSFRADAVDIETCLDAGGGYDIGWTAAGEWLEYTIQVADSGYFDIEYRVATPNANKTISTSIDGTNATGTIKLENTGGYQKWKSFYARNVFINNGQHVLRINFTTGDFNLNYIQISPSVSTYAINMKNENVKIFPNPADNFLYIEGNKAQSGIMNFEIADMSGRIFKTSEIILKSGETAKMNIAYLHPGIYYARIKSGAESQIFKFVKE